MSDPADLVILFADVCGSTRLYETLGDARASAAIAECLGCMADSGRRCKGELVKTIGDEILMIFPRADDAAASACDMHRAVAELPPLAGQSLAIHIGIHQGSAMRQDGDAFGDAVNVSARLVALAKAGQTVISAATLKQLSEEWLNLARQLDSTLLRGKTGQVTVYELLWQPEDATRMVALAQLEQRSSGLRMKLQYQGKVLELGADHTVVTLGRAESCDIVIKHELASRLHARIDFRKNRFLLTDLSTNGTYITVENGETQFVRRDTQVLQEAGVIGLGEAFTEVSPHAIRFIQST